MTQADLDTLSIDEQIETMWRRDSVRDERAKGGAQ